jgi:hypothetical protein
MNCAKQALDGIRKGIQDKKIDPEYARKKVVKLIECKKKHLDEYSPVLVTNIGEIVGCKEHQDFLESIGKN